MDYHTMSLAELKQVARDKTPKIKKYYIKPRAELIKLLMMETLPESFIIEKRTIHELRKEAQTKSIPNIWNMNKSELMELLYPIKMDLNVSNSDNLKKNVRNQD